MKKIFKMVFILVATMFIGMLVVKAELAKELHDVVARSFERVTPCSLLQFDTGESNYLVAKSGSNFVVWTTYPLSVPQQQQFINSFLKAAIDAGDGGPFGNITMSNVIAWLSEDTVYNGGDITITTIGPTIEMTFGAPAAWAQWAKGLLDFVDPEITISVRKIWNQPAGVSVPTSVIVKVMDGTTEVARITLNASNNWKHVFSLPKYDAAEELINYTIEEENVPAKYTVTKENDPDSANTADYKYIIRNTYIPPVTPPQTGDLSPLLMGITAIITGFGIYLAIVRFKEN